MPQLNVNMNLIALCTKCKEELVVRLESCSSRPDPTLTMHVDPCEKCMDSSWDRGIKAQKQQEIQNEQEYQERREVFGEDTI